MKALTVWQPWASLIVEGAKPYEFRGYRPPRSLIGQRVVIHAGKRPIRAAEVFSLMHRLDGHGDGVMPVCLVKDLANPILVRALLRPNLVGALPLSAGIGTAVIGEPRNGYDVAEEFGMPHVNDSDRDEHANWGWPMLDIELWDEPIPMRGAQGLWNWPEPGSIGL